MARMDRLQMSDMRAMELQNERHNPVSGARGGSATPSMGLSMFRGGNFRGGKSKKHHEEESDSDGEACAAGRHLGAHIMKLHGGAYHSAFMKGMGAGGMSGAGHMVGVGGSRTGAYEGEGHCEGGGPISGLNIPIISGLAGMFGLGKEPKTPSKAELQKALAHLKGGAGAENVAEMVGGGIKGWLIHKMARLLLPALKYRVWRLYNAGLSRGQYDDASFEKTLDDLPLG